LDPVRGKASTLHHTAGAFAVTSVPGNDGAALGYVVLGRGSDGWVPSCSPGHPCDAMLLL